tara:strand:- start:12 stop:401 length:390 start_codon:yes stop_codon:yes gene_type:complete
MSELFPQVRENSDNSMMTLEWNLGARIDTNAGTISISPRWPGRGFRYTCPNGWSISIQWHDFAYCAVRDYDGKNTPMNSPDGEIAVFNPEGEMVILSTIDSTLPDNEVLGWQTGDEIELVIAKVERLDR